MFKGNEKIHQLTSGKYELRIDLADWKENHGMPFTSQSSSVVNL